MFKVNIKGTRLRFGVFIVNFGQFSHDFHVSIVGFEQVNAENAGQSLT